LRHENVIDDEVTFALGNDHANFVFDLLEDALSYFDAGRRRRADVKLDLCPVDDGEEVAADHSEHHAPVSGSRFLYRAEPPIAAMISRRAVAGRLSATPMVIGRGMFGRIAVIDQ
jgi:hypothetical protein